MVVMGVVRAAVGAALGIKWRSHIPHPGAQALQHMGDDGVASDQDPVSLNLRCKMSIAEVPREAKERCRILGPHLKKRLVASKDFDNAAILKPEAVAVAKQRGLRQIQKALGSMVRRDDDPAAMARIVVEGRLVRRALPGARVKDFYDADQNRKYLCAMGKTSAGSQVSNSPSARTS